MDSQQTIDSWNWDKAMNLVMTYVSGHLHSRMFNVVMKHSVCDYLEDGPKHYKEIAEAININENMVYRLLRYFTANDLFAEDKDNLGTFMKTPVSSMFSKNGKLKSMGQRYTHDLHYKMFETLPQSFEQNKGLGPKNVGFDHFWEIFDSDPAYKELFNQTMQVYTEAAMSNIRGAIDFSSFNTIVDVGGNHGLLIGNILETHPTVNGINFDLDVVLNAATEKFQHERLKHVPGNFFESVPEADCYILKFILHDWPTEDCVKILQTIGKSMKPGAKIYLFEIIIEPPFYTKYSVYIDILMMQMVNAKERTLNEWNELFDAAGFKLEKVVPEIKTGCMIISKKD
ncbi:hypothetical protein DICPUDRAFT_38446 [Dictyostelium purpureum]|uniref:Uncharacterized protein n=1 Tax=Dictyostelium purpureum TaxID=5786 RepID=F0ZUG9_DICPU|nr:uncharacterized protein DICPUDRAFT_38446 [Dictyostelium purpureum]EGC32413.1 hypothetical protein DICPUDRAFT_38446 [Dictyostelium purpureum]|eukprot:XP_003291060.1 hypothetical protein DICPUDRAFT_38446 [Dictyostelium purpureum]